jgi:hypothetical protein
MGEAIPVNTVAACSNCLRTIDLFLYQQRSAVRQNIGKYNRACHGPSAMAAHT